jgi:hypothetical protein
LSNRDAQPRRNESRDWNVDVLLDSGLRRVPGSNLFHASSGASVLSPGVSAGQHGRWLFDVREANLAKLLDRVRGGVLLRFVPEGFAFIPFETLLPKLGREAAARGANSGVLYRFSCNFDVAPESVMLQSVSDKSLSFTLPLLDQSTVQETLLGL